MPANTVALIRAKVEDYPRDSSAQAAVAAGEAELIPADYANRLLNGESPREPRD